MLFTASADPLVPLPFGLVLLTNCPEEVAPVVLIRKPLIYSLLLPVALFWFKANPTLVNVIAVSSYKVFQPVLSPAKLEPAFDPFTLPLVSLPEPRPLTYICTLAVSYTHLTLPTKA